MLCELETDKVTVEVPATAAGVLAEIVAKEGETVGVDALLATIDEKAAGRSRRQGRAKAAREARRREPPARPRRSTPNRAPANESSIEIMVPTLGESVTEATVSTWFKKVGDAVTQDEMLCELETDKVSVEVPAPASGTLAEIYAEAGATVEAGGKLGRIAGGGAGAGPASAPGRRRRRRRRRARARRQREARRRGRPLGQEADGRPRPLPRPGRGHRPRRPRS